MQVKIKATKLDISDKTKDYIEDKMNMLEKYLGDTPVINCDFEVGLATGSHNKGKIYRAEANLSVPGSLLRVEKTEKDLGKAIDKVKDHLARSIRRYKDKKLTKKRRGK